MEQTLLLMGLVGIVTALVNYFPAFIETLAQAIGGKSLVHALDPQASSYLPWINLYLGFAFSLHLANLCTGRRLLISHWVDLVLNAYGVGLLLWIGFGQNLFTDVETSLLARFLLILMAILSCVHFGSEARYVGINFKSTK
ncbi:MAG: hypothetical protein M1281_17720 [Chloroflexi bacterium]|nr:hypothetical protein [Chloroflexota bacterium]